MNSNQRTTQSDTDHYYSAQPEAKSQPEQFTISVREMELTLTSDRGVFSHGRLDDGTLRLLKKMELPEAGDFLDLGCGYGVIGLVAAKLRPEARVTMVDINERATRLTADNAQANGISNVEVLTGDAPQVLDERRFDVVLCNPPIRVGKPKLYELIADAAQRLRTGGVLWMVIHTRQGAKTHIRKMAPMFSECETVSRKWGYRIFKCEQ